MTYFRLISIVVISCFTYLRRGCRPQNGIHLPFQSVQCCGDVYYFHTIYLGNQFISSHPYGNMWFYSAKNPNVLNFIISDKSFCSSLKNRSFRLGRKALISQLDKCRGLEQFVLPFIEDVDDFWIRPPARRISINIYVENWLTLYRCEQILKNFYNPPAFEYVDGWFVRRKKNLSFYIRSVFQWS